ncbi:hypothetical protein ScPMuIL_006884 [Solemya velum]
MGQDEGKVSETTRVAGRGGQARRWAAARTRLGWKQKRQAHGDGKCLGVGRPKPHRPSTGGPARERQKHGQAESIFVMGCVSSTQQPRTDRPLVTNTNTSNNAKGQGIEPKPAGPSQTGVPGTPEKQKQNQISQNQTRSDVPSSQSPPVVTSMKSSKDTDIKVSQKSESKTNTKHTKDTTASDVESRDSDRLQKQFDTAMASTCLLLKPDCLTQLNMKEVSSLCLKRALPSTFSLKDMLGSLGNVKEIDLSNNQLGPQGVRAVCLAMGSNSTILRLNIAGNKTDTDTAESLGKLLELNITLQYLDVSSNYLGKDYFSRCVGPKFKTSKLRTLKAKSIGSTDLQILMDNLADNKHLMDLDLSSNEISDRNCLGAGIGVWCKNPECSLSSLSLGQCDMSPSGLEELMKGLSENHSVRELNLSGNEKFLLEFLCTIIRHPSLTTLSLDDARIKDLTMEESIDPVIDKPSPLKILSLQNCSLTDQFFVTLASCCKGVLNQLTDLDIGSNDHLSPACMESIQALTTVDDSSSSLTKLTYSLNDASSLFDELLSKKFPKLQYFNMRNAKIPIKSVEKLAPLIQRDNPVTSLNLDGLKLSGTSALQVIFEKPAETHLTSLSLGGCSLEDSDLSPLTDSVQARLEIHMLKLSANRITDTGVGKLVSALLSNGSHPLAVLDLSDNRIKDAGGVELSKLFSTEGHQSNLHSLNLSANSLGLEGLIALASCVGGTSPLSTLYLYSQSSSLLESQTEEVFSKLAESLGFTVQKDGEKVKTGCSDLPKLPDSLVVNMTGVGGPPGQMGSMLSSACVLTDSVQSYLPYLSFAHIMDICAFIKGLGKGNCVWSVEEWKMITGASRPTTDTPSWLQLPTHRDLAMYLSNLPGNTTQQKVESLLEMEADCNLDEVCLMKDPVTRQVNGSGWVLMNDKASVQKAQDFFFSGEAVIFGQPFMISPVCVCVDDEASTELEKKAKEDMARRVSTRKQEDAAHQSLIRQNAEESWKRHAYRLAHPAYADGRIW